MSAEAWAAWAQAIASAVAIVAAGRIATSQSKRQFEDTRRLQLETRKQADYQFAQAVAQIAHNAARTMGMVNDAIGNLNGLHRVSFGEYFDREALRQMIAALQAVPLHELRSTSMVIEVMALTATLRQVDSQVDKAIEGYTARPRPEPAWTAFFDALGRSAVVAMQSRNEIYAEVTKLKPSF